MNRERIISQLLRSLEDEDLIALKLEIETVQRERLGLEFITKHMLRGLEISKRKPTTDILRRGLKIKMTEAHDLYRKCHADGVPIDVSTLPPEDITHLRKLGNRVAVVREPKI